MLSPHQFRDWEEWIKTIAEDFGNSLARRNESQSGLIEMYGRNYIYPTLWLRPMIPASFDHYAGVCVNDDLRPQTSGHSEPIVKLEQSYCLSRQCRSHNALHMREIDGTLVDSTSES